MRDRRELWLIAFGMFLGLVAAEVFSRAILEWFPLWPQVASHSFGLIYENAPHAVQVDPAGHRFVFNQWGMRQEEFPLAKPAGEKRILFLGDSILEGCGIDQKDTAAQLVADALNKDRVPKGVTVRTLNTGAPSYNLWDYWYYLQSKGWRFSPDGVVLFMCLNDSAAKSLALPALRPGEAPPFKFRLKHYLLKSRLIFLLLYKVHLRDTIAWLWTKVTPSHAPVASDAHIADVLATLDPSSRAAVQEWADAHWGGSLQPVRDAFDSMLLEDTWPRALPILTMMRDDARAHGAFFKVLVFPVSFQLLPGYKDSRPQGLITDYMKKEGIDHVDLRDAFRAGMKDHDTLYIPGDMLHPNEPGNRIAADQVLKLLTKEFPPAKK